MKKLLLGAGSAFVVLTVPAGYGFNWRWTGFPGNTLWDWLHLLLVPVTLPFFAHELNERQKKKKELAEARHKAAGQDLRGPATAWPEGARAGGDLAGRAGRELHGA